MIVSRLRACKRTMCMDWRGVNLVNLDSTLWWIQMISVNMWGPRTRQHKVTHDMQRSWRATMELLFPGSSLASSAETAQAPGKTPDWYLGWTWMLVALLSSLQVSCLLQRAHCVCSQTRLHWLSLPLQSLELVITKLNNIWMQKERCFYEHRVESSENYYKAVLLKIIVLK